MIIIRRKKRKVPGLNTSSTADISFMLLIFFLVTTSMDVDKGIFRLLPSPEPQKQMNQESVVDKNTLMALHVTADNQLLLNGQPMEVNHLQEKIVNFVHRLGKRHLISIESDREANYNLYFQLQNQIMLAYNQLRDEYAQKRYHQSFSSLQPKQKDMIRKECPQRVTESYSNANTQEDKSVGAEPDEKKTGTDEKKGGKS